MTYKGQVKKWSRFSKEGKARPKQSAFPPQWHAMLRKSEILWIGITTVLFGAVCSLLGLLGFVAD
jgi:hypothetical protein